MNYSNYSNVTMALKTPTQRPTGWLPMTSHTQALNCYTAYCIVYRGTTFKHVGRTTKSIFFDSAYIESRKVLN